MRWVVLPIMAHFQPHLLRNKWQGMRAQNQIMGIGLAVLAVVGTGTAETDGDRVVVVVVFLVVGVKLQIPTAGICHKTQC